MLPNLVYLLHEPQHQLVYRDSKPDGTKRFHDKDGKDIFHFMGCSTMGEYAVLAEISCAKIPKEMALEEACFFGCGVSTGIGAVWNTSKVEPLSNTRLPPSHQI